MAPEDVLKMIDSPHTQLELTTENPCMAARSLEEQAFFNPGCAGVFENMWHSSTEKPDMTNTDCPKNTTGHLYIFQRNIFVLFVTRPTELPPGNVGNMAD
jgi:hypothetical protein